MRNWKDFCITWPLTAHWLLSIWKYSIYLKLTGALTEKKYTPTDSNYYFVKHSFYIEQEGFAQKGKTWQNSKHFCTASELTAHWLFFGKNSIYLKLRGVWIEKSMETKIYSPGSNYYYFCWPQFYKELVGFAQWRKTWDNENFYTAWVLTAHWPFF